MVSDNLECGQHQEPTTAQREERPRMSRSNRGRKGTGEDEPAIETSTSTSAEPMQDIVRLLMTQMEKQQEREERLERERAEREQAREQQIAEWDRERDQQMAELFNTLRTREHGRMIDLGSSSERLKDDG